MATESIILDGQMLSGTDRFGEWTTTGLDGWWSSPEPKGGDSSRPNADGDFDTPVKYEARYITITGSLRAKSHELQHHASDRFTGLVRTRARMQVVGHGDPQWVDVVRASALKMEPVTDTYAKWQVRLKAPDPRKFGKVHIEELTGGRSRSLYHYGNTEAAPLVEIRGPITGGYQINSNDGRVFRVNSGIASGARHTIDMNDGLLRVNGRVQAGLVGQADVWKIPPGLLPSGGTLNMALRPDVASETPVGSVYITDTYV